MKLLHYGIMVLFLVLVLAPPERVVELSRSEAYLLVPRTKWISG